MVSTHSVMVYCLFRCGDEDNRDPSGVDAGEAGKELIAVSYWLAGRNESLFEDFYTLHLGQHFRFACGKYSELVTKVMHINRRSRHEKMGRTIV